MQIPHQIHTSLGGKHLCYWNSSDSEARWQANMRDPECRKRLEDAGYGHHLSIRYRFNKFGFRCDEFDQTPCVVALGCSFTSGVGLREEDIWCTQLARRLNLSLVNLGVAGGSMDTCARLLYHWLPQLDARLVCMLEPPSDRFEVKVPSDYSPRVFAPNFVNSPYEVLPKIWYSDDANSQINLWKNRLVLAQICDKHRVPLVSTDLCTGLMKFKSDGQIFPPARDLMHEGARSHVFCADYFELMIKQQGITV